MVIAVLGQPASAAWAGEAQEPEEAPLEEAAGPDEPGKTDPREGADAEALGEWAPEGPDGDKQPETENFSAEAEQLRLAAERLLARARQLEGAQEPAPDETERAMHLRLAAEHLEQAGESEIARALLEAADGRTQKVSSGREIMLILYGLEDSMDNIERGLAKLRRDLLDFRDRLLQQLEKPGEEKDSPKAAVDARE